MRVCLVVEGTYPYVAGGVSEWIQMLIENMPDVEFDVVHLAPWQWNRPFRYELPRNLEHLYEYPLFSTNPNPDELGKNVDIKNVIAKVRNMIELSNENRSKEFANLLRLVTGKNLDNVLKKRQFWDFLIEMYEHYFSDEGFTGFYWTIIGFLIPILGAIQSLPPRADIYHSTTTGYASLSALMGKYLYGGKLIITEHGIYHREREIEITKSNSISEIYKPVWIEIFKLISKVVYEECDSLTALFEKNQLFQLELGADFSKMRVISNGVNVDRFSTVKREDHETFNIGVVGRVVPIKDIITAIKSFDIVRKEVPNAVLYIIGPNDEDEEYYERCKALTELLHIDDRVVFTGKVDVREYYGKLDVLLISSISEGQPLVQLEAMASGIPVVTTNVGNCAEIALDPDGQSGFVVRSKDYISMSEKIITLAKDKSLWSTFSENGKKVAAVKYTLGRMISDYKKLYYEVMNGAQG